jgi:hypothetical protein
MPKTIYNNEIITSTLATPDLLSGTIIGTFQEDYRLCEADYLRLKTSKPVTLGWANGILLATLGYGLSLIPKLFDKLTGKPVEIAIGEWLTLLIGICLSILLYLIGLALPNDRKAVMKEIENHFKSAPKSRQIIRENK